MQVLSIRRVTADHHHNAFTGTEWFQGALYLAFRQGDAHICDQGRLIVLRSRDGGVNFEPVAAFRGMAKDLRDAHLYSVDDRRLFLVGFEYNGETLYRQSGTAWTDNGLSWSPWTSFAGTNGWVLWRPEYFQGRYYCAGYHAPMPIHEESEWCVAWFESDDGLHWRKVRILRQNRDLPNESSLAFRSDGLAAILMRREVNATPNPLLFRSMPPYDQWTVMEMNVPLRGPALWFVGHDIWIGGRWFLPSGSTHVGIFKAIHDEAVLQCVLPSGPGSDCSYIGVAPNPSAPRRVWLSYYSPHVAPADPAVSQWTHPDVYVADVICDEPFIQSWQVSDVSQQIGGLNSAIYPVRNEDVSMVWTGERANMPCGYVEARRIIGKRAGIVYFVAEIQAESFESAVLQLGYDGPIRVWLNGREIFKGVGSVPAQPDQSNVDVQFQAGANRLVIAMDTDGGRAGQIYARTYSSALK